MADSADGAMPAEPAGAPVIHGAHVQLYARGPAAAVHWRLLSGNHRDLGRGVHDFPDEESCRLGIKEIAGAIDQLLPGIVRVPGNRWGWRLTLDGDPVVSSGHSFDRRARCEEACARFLLLMPSADVRNGVAFLVSGGVPHDDGGVIPRPRLGIGERWSAVHRTSADRSIDSDGLSSRQDTETRRGEALA
jgi:hypothetical protein